MRIFGNTIDLVIDQETEEVFDTSETTVSQSQYFKEIGDVFTLGLADRLIKEGDYIFHDNIGLCSVIEADDGEGFACGYYRVQPLHKDLVKPAHSLVSMGMKEMTREYCAFYRLTEDIKILVLKRKP